MNRRPRRGRRERPGPAGFLVVDKPRGSTSHDLVEAARRWLGTRRVGHLGTLDPLATGVLPLAVREATKLVPFVPAGPKIYVGQIRLGEVTDTDDAEGAVLRSWSGALPDEARVREALAGFQGDVDQVPPRYSAVKRGGVPLHRLAREGRDVEPPPPKRIRIERIVLHKYAPPDVEIEVECSPGTYVRALARDLGERLGCGGHLAWLRRTRSGPFDLAQAHTESRLAQAAEAGEIASLLIPPVNVLGLPVLRLAPQEVETVRHGGELPAPDPLLPPGRRVAALGPDGELMALLEMRPGRRLRPVRVLRPVAPPR